MSKVVRTPKSTTTKVSRKPGNLKQIALYEKKVTLTLIGEPSDLQSVMSDVHSFIGTHKLVKGGKLKRKVCVSHTSTVPTKIFDGRA